MSIMPQEFRQIASLSDESCTEQIESQQLCTATELNNRRSKSLEEAYSVGRPTLLISALSILSDDLLKQLNGWVQFGMNYNSEDGNAVVELLKYIDSAFANSRNQTVNSLIEQPIGKYLRDAAMYLDVPME